MRVPLIHGETSGIVSDTASLHRVLNEGTRPRRTVNSFAALFTRAFVAPHRVAFSGNSMFSFIAFQVVVLYVSIQYSLKIEVRPLTFYLHT